MSSTPSIATAASTITNPMSAVFTPPSSCSSHWTYEAQSANSISGGLLLQDAQFDRPDTSCFPTGFGGWGRAPSFIQIFSPGACPIGYTTANNNFNTEATTAICCPRYRIIFLSYCPGFLLMISQRFPLYVLFEQCERWWQDCRILWMYEHVRKGR